MRERAKVVKSLRAACEINTVAVTISFEQVHLDAHLERYFDECLLTLLECVRALRKRSDWLGDLWKVEGAGGQRDDSSGRQKCYLHAHFEVAIARGVDPSIVENFFRPFSKDVLAKPSDDGWTDYFVKGFTNRLKWKPDALKEFLSRINAWWESTGKPKLYGFGGVFNGKTARGPKRLAELVGALDAAGKGSVRQRYFAMQEPFMRLARSATMKWMDKVPPKKNRE